MNNPTHFTVDCKKAGPGQCHLIVFDSLAFNASLSHLIN